MGVIAKDGFCRPFDEKASGYTRSEAICVMYLQRKKDAKRIYANLVYSKANCDGFKIEGITYPSGEMQQQLLTEFYDDLQLDPTSLTYIEAHATGTVVGDPEECKALDNIFCKNRKDPLLVGSVKSNIGHTESSSGACSIAKVILTFENELIPPNIHFDKIRSEIPALVEKRMIVCSETTPFKGDKIAINSFGFGGANGKIIMCIRIRYEFIKQKSISSDSKIWVFFSLKILLLHLAHALLSMNKKNKINGGSPDDNIPRLVNWAARTKEGVDTMLNALEEQPLDAEYIGLLHNVQSEETQGYLYRGYTILSKGERNQSPNKAVCLTRATKRCDSNKLPVVWLFSGMF